MQSFKIDYKTNCSELCVIGRNYDTDKSSQRVNPYYKVHSHPYTLFYDSLFRSKKDEPLNIAEIGIYLGGSIRMWKEYFPNSSIYGFDNNNDLIARFTQNHADLGIPISFMDVTDEISVQTALNNLNIMYDIFIEDSTNTLDDQIRVIENVYPYLKPGGVFIIEDIYKASNENDYIERLAPILQHFQDYYFVELDHINRNSDGWDNDKIMVLVKGGGEPIFKNPNKITIITPSFRTNNLVALKNSINFDYVNEWIIVHDGSKMAENPNVFANENNSKIKEYIHTGEGYLGNAQRNYALDNITITDTILYYLDDDNIIHPSLYKLLDIVDKNKIYTFNQIRTPNTVLKGDNITIGNIDTAMILIDYSLCSSIRWENNRYDADGYYITQCYGQNQDKHIFADNVLCYYNKLCID
jgi:SAM-dependent methyltransferase